MTFPSINGLSITLVIDNTSSSIENNINSNTKVVATNYDEVIGLILV